MRASLFAVLGLLIAGCGGGGSSSSGSVSSNVVNFPSQTTTYHGTLYNSSSVPLDTGATLTINPNGSFNFVAPTYGLTYSGQITTTSGDSDTAGTATYQGQSYAVSNVGITQFLNGSIHGSIQWLVGNTVGPAFLYVVS
jgi:hypothetical protein